MSADKDVVIIVLAGLLAMVLAAIELPPNRRDDYRAAPKLEGRLMSDWAVFLFWQGAVVIIALFFGSLAGTFTQLVWGHWGGWFLGLAILLVWVFLMVLGFIASACQGTREQR